ncbi:hypothetical protein VNI00_017014 [Paramarasmius palmivorus]|uniref:Uncharacterized protein n=1 Tax=Paramarasmius palmivorus TaxID=297713 RepID=A0AAW0B9R9_9AGAR
MPYGITSRDIQGGTFNDVGRDQTNNTYRGQVVGHHVQIETMTVGCSHSQQLVKRTMYDEFEYIKLGKIIPLETLSTEDLSQLELSYRSGRMVGRLKTRVITCTVTIGKDKDLKLIAMMYEGEDAHKAWERDFQRVSGIKEPGFTYETREPGLPQLFAIDFSKNHHTGDPSVKSMAMEDPTLSCLDDPLQSNLPTQSLAQDAPSMFASARNFSISAGAKFNNAKRDQFNSELHVEDLRRYNLDSRLTMIQHLHFESYTPVSPAAPICSEDALHVEDQTISSPTILNLTALETTEGLNITMTVEGQLYNTRLPVPLIAEAAHSLGKGEDWTGNTKGLTTLGTIEKSEKAEGHSGYTKQSHFPLQPEGSDSMEKTGDQLGDSVSIRYTTDKYSVDTTIRRTRIGIRAKL